ncbi:MAG: hypothetical protein HYR88_02940 [Verrucomicrobia bacterium]|nr:hypothetical protein [Verrucomicrobiota bacterium]
MGLGALGARVAAANSLDPVIRKSGAARADTIEIITIPPDPQSVIAAQAERPKRMDRHHRGFVEFSEYLEDELRDDPTGKALRARKSAPAPLNRWVVAMERFERFKKQMEESTPAQRRATVKRIETSIKASTKAST